MSNTFSTIEKWSKKILKWYQNIVYCFFCHIDYRTEINWEVRMIVKTNKGWMWLYKNPSVSYHYIQKTQFKRNNQTIPWLKLCTLFRNTRSCWMSKRHCYLISTFHWCTNIFLDFRSFIRQRNYLKKDFYFYCSWLFINSVCLIKLIIILNKSQVILSNRWC
jgi:hypothetical protein